jgi:predicted nuclease with TOPRIM domain
MSTLEDLILEISSLSVKELSVLGDRIITRTEKITTELSEKRKLLVTLEEGCDKYNECVIEIQNLMKERRQLNPRY